MRKELLKSLILHSALVVLCLLVWERREIPARARRGQPIQIEVARGSGSGQNAGESDRNARQGNISRNRLRNGLESLAPATPFGAGPKSSDDGGRGMRDGYDVAADMTLEQETRALPFLEALRNRIDGVIAYPEDFVDERVEGSVTVHFNVDRTGAIQGDFVRVDSEDTLLEAYVLAILAHVLGGPLPERSWGEKGMTIVSRFEFKVLAGFAGTAPPRSSRIKNLLTFRRESVGEPWLNREIERFYTRYIPPFIPVPGGFFIDFVRAYKMIASIDSQEATSRDRRGRRIELNREKWQLTVKGGKGGRLPTVPESARSIHE